MQLKHLDGFFYSTMEQQKMDNLEELKQLKQWVLWAYEPNQDPTKKPVKVPRQPNGNKAGTTYPNTWSAYSDCLAALPGFDGLGFVFSDDDPYVGIDIDGKTDSELVKRFDTYAELSPSGKGLHIIGKLERPLARGRKNDAIGIEMYDRSRYFTMTFNAVNDAPIRYIDADYVLSTYFPEVKQQKLSRTKETALEDDLEAIAVNDALDVRKVLAKAFKHDNFKTENKARFNGNLAYDAGDASKARYHLIKLFYYHLGNVRDVYTMLMASHLPKDDWFDVRNSLPKIIYDIELVINKNFAT